MCKMDVILKLNREIFAQRIFFFFLSFFNLIKVTLIKWNRNISLNLPKNTIYQRHDRSNLRKVEALMNILNAQERKFHVTNTGKTGRRVKGFRIIRCSLMESLNNFEYIHKLTSYEKSVRLSSFWFVILFIFVCKWLLIKANSVWRMKSYKMLDITIPFSSLISILSAMQRKPLKSVWIEISFLFNISQISLKWRRQCRNEKKKRRRRKRKEREWLIKNASLWNKFAQDPKRKQILSASILLLLLLLILLLLLLL